MKKELDYNVSIRSAIVFLNTFGLILEEKDILGNGTELNIYDKENNVVGKTILNGNIIRMKAQSSYGTLNASYEVGFMSGGIDYESCNAPKYIRWSNHISFKIYNDKKLLMNGNFSVNVSADEEFGINCLAHPSFIYYANDGSMLELKFQTDGKVFYLEYQKDDLREMIDLTPYYDRYFCHQITKGKFNNDWPYIKLHVLRNGEGGDLSDEFETLVVESIKGKETIREFKTEKKVASEYDNSKSEEVLEQKASLVQTIGSDAFNKIQKVIEIFNVNNNSLIDNFVSVSLTSYSDSCIKGFLGIDRKSFMFQNSTDDLENAYFGKNKNKLLGWTFPEENDDKNGISFTKKTI